MILANSNTLLTWTINIIIQLAPLLLVMSIFAPNATGKLVKRLVEWGVHILIALINGIVKATIPLISAIANALERLLEIAKRFPLFWFALVALIIYFIIKYYWYGE